MKRHSGSARERPTARQLPEMTGRVSTCMFSPLRLGLPPAELYGGTCLCTGMGEVRKFVDRKGFAGRPTLHATRGEARRALAQEPARRHNVTTADHIACSRHRHWVSSAPAPLPSPFGFSRTRTPPAELAHCAFVSRLTAIMDTGVGVWIAV